MTDGPTYLTFDVSISDQRIRIPMFKGSELERKYATWRSTEDDTDFDDLIAWVNDDIADQLEFYVEDVN